MTRADKFLAATILGVALLGLVLTYRHLFTSAGQVAPTQAIIRVQGQVVRTIDLDPDGVHSTFLVSGRLGAATVEVSDAKIRMHEATCLGQICVKQGWITHPGESIVCVPGEIVIHLTGPSTVDAVTR